MEEIENESMLAPEETEEVESTVSPEETEETSNEETFVDAEVVQKIKPKQKQKWFSPIVFLCILLTVILLPFLAANTTLIVKGFLNPDVPPDLFGTMPLCVMTGSMEGDKEDSFNAGDLVLVRVVDKQTLQKDDIITFSIGKEFITHRIVALNYDESGVLVSVETKGDANNTTDGQIMLDQIHGKKYATLSGFGQVLMFMQRPLGMILFIGIPVVIYIMLIIMESFMKKRQNVELEAKDKEIERLKELLSSVQKTGEVEQSAEESEDAIPEE